jgi:uncharacterized protein DUF6801
MGVGLRWVRGRLLRVAAIGVVLFTVGVLPGAGGAAAAQTTTDVDTVYSCEFPSGPQQVKVRVTASLPKESTVGNAVRPGEPTISIATPQAALGDLTKLEAAAVGATVKLAVQVGHQGKPIPTTWQDLSAAQTTVPQDGDLTLVASGEVPAVTPTVAGEATFVAERLDIELVPRKIDGSATSPAVIPLACTPVIGYDTTIGIVSVAEAVDVGPGRRLPAQSRQLAAEGDGICPPPVTGGLNDDFPKPPVPDGAEVFPGTPQDGCAVLDGLSNVRKLNGATSIGGLGSIKALIGLIADTTPPGDYLRTDNIAFAHLEAKRATLLTFGFMPVSATMEITQIGNMNIIGEGPAIVRGPPTLTTGHGRISLRLTDARVNGVPLDLGPNCRSSRNIELELHGSTASDPPYEVNFGGMLTGEITIPPFAGCGVTEDLDPLLTASVSGPGNLVRIIQGPLCDPLRPDTNGQPCPPTVFGFTVEPGGKWKATSDLMAFRLPPTLRPSLPPLASLDCPIDMAGSFRSGSGINPAEMGKITDFSSVKCAAPPPFPTEFTVTPRDLPWTFDGDFYLPAADAVTAHFRNIVLRFSAEGCTFDLANRTVSTSAGTFQFLYDNATHALTLLPTGSRVASLSVENVNGCATGFTRPLRNGDRLTIGSTVVFDPRQTIRAP